MADGHLHLSLQQLLLLLILLPCCTYSGDPGGSKLHQLLRRKRDASSERGAGPLAVAVAPSRAHEFLTALRRPRRNIWDRSRPDVQQWIMQFMHMGYDEATLESHLAYWMDHSRSTDHGRQHHYDENAALRPQDPGSYRHGADVNYDYY